MLPQEIVERCKPLATPEGRQSAAASVTLAQAALGRAQQGSRDVIATQDAATGRLQAAQDRLANIQQELRSVRLQIGTEAIHGIDLAGGRWSQSVTQAMAKPSARRRALLDETVAIGEALAVMSDHFAQDAPKLFAAALAEAEAGLSWLHAAADLATVDLLIAVAPVMALDANMNVIASTGSVITAHALAISEQVVRVDEARQKLRDAESRAAAL
jgi:hypothetical protein